MNLELNETSKILLTYAALIIVAAALIFKSFQWMVNSEDKKTGKNTKVARPKKKG